LVSIGLLVVTVKDELVRVRVRVSIGLLVVTVKDELVVDDNSTSVFSLRPVGNGAFAVTCQSTRGFMNEQPCSTTNVPPAI